MERPVQALINAAISRAAQGEEVSRRAGLPVYIATVTQGLNVRYNFIERVKPS